MFDKEIFARLLEKARGERDNQTYADDSGVSRSYISTYINSKNDQPPSASVLKKLALAAHNNISFNDLMIAAGYINNEKQNDIIKVDEDLEKYIAEKETKISISSIIEGMEKTLTDPYSIELIKQLKEIIKNDPETGDNYFTVFNEAKKANVTPAALLNFLKIVDEANKKSK